MSNHSKIIAAELAVTEKQVIATIELLDEGATVPFISRYRKEVTGSLDEVQVAGIRDRFQQLRELDKRREAILKALTALDKLTPELEAQINAATNIAAIEDIYLPYKPKRKTRASEARKKGLEPLALFILEQAKTDPEIEAGKFLNDELGVGSLEDALAGARDIIAELVNENAEARTAMRNYFQQKAVFKSAVIKGKEEEGIKYKDYFDWQEPLKNAPSHRVLAIRRGENEAILKLEAMPEEDGAIRILESQFVKGNNACADQVKLAIQDSYKRLLGPSMETEIRNLSKEKADEEAIRVFAENARQLLLAAPMGQKNVLAIDPGFRTGCKVVCLDKQGKLLENATIYPHTGQGNVKKAGDKIKELCAKYEIEAVAIGNGTAGRETEVFVRALNIPGIVVVMVSENGASIYSASEVAREEFPTQDITVRGAVSIGRRLMDPLAELVKIDPKSIGVGQYQHDVDQNKLQASLDDTVMSCVNAVGVELNTASKQVLAYVSGLGPQLAQNIVAYRNEHGAFKNRESLKKVPRLGDKAFEQAAGFLRIRNAEAVLDSSGVHPERYALVHKMARDLNCSINQLVKDPSLQQQIKLQQYVSDDIGLPTLNDIMSELAKPGRDPREQFEVFSFTEGVNEISDLKVGMKLPGIVTNITNFGAFVDIGVHQDGLVHTSQISDKFVANAADVVKVHQKVEVTVVEVDVARKRISLSMKKEVGAKPKSEQHKQADKAKKFVKTNGSAQHKKPIKPQHSHKGGQKEKPLPDGDLQMKLAALKNMFKTEK
ncbi:Tex family protein [Pedobacter heparinus]|uniref:RNA binding S1 domain protein n=1 Tax=Pedobacter heparinus (strain ATCC 13125 / DSM 2366 / CIP 104194 / JCM 7457 / NBRC 12017 / NCIMB 9290 / NRRL B-14731 / HIM 762-3) TaxID=485917 RepID=C6XX62_PEDHD|nr:Tex family protein [Pedobacter heparinus]ACU06368.1 RNA binding S1 domain protein [Pedobacter heparinus DSM 2366]